MTTDDERRRVAERLRWMAEGHLDPWVGYTYDAVMGYFPIVGGTSAYAESSYLEYCSRLAELIDPDTTTDTTKSAEDTTKAPTSSDTTATYTDASATCDVLQSRRDTVACDREALLALAEELDDCGLDGWACGPLDVGGFARRIREACGEGTS